MIYGEKFLVVSPSSFVIESELANVDTILKEISDYSYITEALTKESFKKVIDKIKDVFTKVIDLLKNTFGKAYNQIINFLDRTIGRKIDDFLFSGKGDGPYTLDVSSYELNNNYDRYTSEILKYTNMIRLFFGIISEYALPECKKNGGKLSEESTNKLNKLATEVNEQNQKVLEYADMDSSSNEDLEKKFIKETVITLNGNGSDKKVMENSKRELAEKFKKQSKQLNDQKKKNEELIASVKKLQINISKLYDQATENNKGVDFDWGLGGFIMYLQEFSGAEIRHLSRWSRIIKIYLQKQYQEIKHLISA